MDILQTLNPPQREAVLHTEGPLLLLAGAGSGKTRVLTHRIAFLISEHNVAPWNILAITFTNKAAGEMRQRVDALVGTGSEEVWVSTFHACCLRILRRFIGHLELNYSGSFVVFDTEDQKSVMKDIFRRRNIDTKRYKEKGMLARISAAKEQGLEPSDVEKDAGCDQEDRLLADIYREYQRTLRDNNALDFDDLLLLTVRLFQKDPEVLGYYQERFRYIMVDEYQDTNHIQFLFVSLLAGRYRNLCVVGDDDQSIYKFRGADIRNILDFEDTFPDTKVIRLEQNYRSTKNILAAANGVISHNEDRKQKTLWTDNDQGSPIHVRRLDTALEEAEYVVDEIASRHREENRPYRDFAVLYRTNAQSRMFEEKLVAAGIPYVIVGGINFYARKEIKDLVCYLRAIDNPSDDLAVGRIVNVPKRGIGATTLDRIRDYAMEQGLRVFYAMEQADEIPGLGRGGAKLKSFVTLLNALRTKAQSMTVSELLQEITDVTGYLSELKLEGTPDAQARIENIEELFNTAAAYEQACREQSVAPTLSDFLGQIALVADIDRTSDEDDYVLLMTLHSAKGLEFPVVYMAGMDDGIFPGYAVIYYGDHEDLEEERRLCYVGITRARQELTMISARRRFLKGKYEDYTPSRFIKEVPREVAELGDSPVPRVSQAQKLAAARQEGTAMNRIFQPYPGGESPGSGGRRTFSSYPGNVPAARPVSNAPLKSLDYQEGDMVRHVKYGIGRVISIASGGRDFEVTVEFERFGVKKMFAGFAKLVKL